MDASVVVVVVVVVAALVFDFTNGFHDTANAMATSIATGALRPRVAVVIAGALNLVGAFLSVQVALTISGGLVDEARITPAVVLAALVGAIVWNLVTWLLGLPSSSSHALFGGLIGATLVAGGIGAVHVDGVLRKIVLPAVVSPLLAGVAALALTVIAYRLTRRVEARTAQRGFRAGQVASASLVALAHGANDAQKTMGVITLTLITAGVLAPGSAPPPWVVLSAALAIALGTCTGGWRIIRTLGRRIGDLRPTQGFTAETTSAAVILVSTNLGVPVSTTQVCTGSIFGAAAGRRPSSVRWGLARRLVLAWVVTLPAAAALGAVASWVASTGTTGVVAVVVGGIAVGCAVFAASRRNRVTSHNVTDLPVPPPGRRLAA